MDFLSAVLANVLQQARIELPISFKAYPGANVTGVSCTGRCALSDRTALSCAYKAEIQRSAEACLSTSRMHYVGGTIACLPVGVVWTLWR